MTDPQESEGMGANDQRQEFEVSDDEEYENAMGIIRGDPPPYHQPVQDSDIDPILLVQAATASQTKKATGTQKKRSSKKNGTFPHDTIR